MANCVTWLDRTIYPGITRNWDDLLFRERILQRLEPGETALLDLGAGAGNVSQMNFKGCARRVCGIDPDPRVLTNPYLDEGKVGVGETIPYAADVFDVVFADNVLEHLESPAHVFAEVFRVLKPGGRFFVKTPNKYHYMPLIARSTPHQFHQWYNRLRGRGASHTFPTFYRANSRADLERLATRTGFSVSSIELIEGRPEYMRLSCLTYVLGLAYERVVNASTLLSNLRILVVGELMKPAS